MMVIFFLFRMIDQLGSELESKQRLEENYVEKISKLEKSLGRKEKDIEVSFFKILSPLFSLFIKKKISSILFSRLSLNFLNVLI